MAESFLGLNRDVHSYHVRIKHNIKIIRLATKTTPERLRSKKYIYINSKLQSIGEGRKHGEHTAIPGARAEQPSVLRKAISRPTPANRADTGILRRDDSGTQLGAPPFARDRHTPRSGSIVLRKIQVPL